MISEIDLQDWVIYPTTTLNKVKDGEHFSLNGIVYQLKSKEGLFTVCYDLHGRMANFNVFLDVNPLKRKEN